MASAISFKLVVIRTSRMAEVRRFYEALGIALEEERHGEGPVHYAGRVGDVVFEVYPIADGGSPDVGTRLGFGVADLEQVLAVLKQEVTLPKQSAWGLRAVVRDPDGRKVELYTQGGAPS